MSALFITLYQEVKKNPHDITGDVNLQHLVKAVSTRRLLLSRFHILFYGSKSLSSLGILKLKQVE